MPGHPAVPFRKIFDGILSVLRTGCQWSALPRSEFAPKSTVWGRFNQWSQAGVFQQAWALALRYYDLEVGIDWKWQSLDGVITKAPLGGETTGPSPVDRAKSGTKRSVLSDGRGAPLSVIVKGANAHDKTLALETLDSIPVERPPRRVYRLHHLCLDAGYDFEDVIGGVQERDYRMHLKKRGAEPVEVLAEKKYPARRWVVERTHSWHNRFRRLLVRWEFSIEVESTKRFTKARIARILARTLPSFRRRKGRASRFAGAEFLPVLEKTSDCWRAWRLSTGDDLPSGFEPPLSGRVGKLNSSGNPFADRAKGSWEQADISVASETSN
jgi:putative transposase